MNAAPKFPYVAVLVISMFTFAACNNNSGAPAVKFTIGGTVVNLAGTAGGLVLQDNMQNNLSVNANGAFTFVSTVPSGTAYSITISTQPSSPAQTCGVTNASGTARANVTNIEVNCGHNEWTWVKGAGAVGNTVRKACSLPEISLALVLSRIVGSTQTETCGSSAATASPQAPKETSATSGCTCHNTRCLILGRKLLFHQYLPYHRTTKLPPKCFLYRGS